VVNITLVPPSGGMADVERELEQVYGLKEAVVVPVGALDDTADVIQALGPAAAACLMRCLSSGQVVGVTWGRTMLALVDALPSKSWSDLTIVQVTGGLGPVGAVEHSTELARRIAQKFNAKLRLLPAPGIVSSQAAAEALRSDYQIAETLRMAAAADVAVVGLGVPATDSVLLRDGNILTPEDLRRLLDAGAVGDMALRFIDAQGNAVALEINERIIGLTLDQIQAIPRVIGVAGGQAKRAMIRAALSGGYLDVLVTDDVTAAWLLDREAVQGRGEREVVYGV
jgi:DNA-binding transcriptional regulator LsrR (DeoR family)